MLQVHRPHRPYYDASDRRHEEYGGHIAGLTFSTPISLASMINELANWASVNNTLTQIASDETIPISLSAAQILDLGKRSMKKLFSEREDLPDFAEVTTLHQAADLLFKSGVSTTDGEQVSVKRVVSETIEMSDEPKGFKLSRGVPCPCSHYFGFNRR